MTPACFGKDGIKKKENHTHTNTAFHKVGFWPWQNGHKLSHFQSARRKTLHTAPYFPLGCEMRPHPGCYRRSERRWREDSLREERRNGSALGPAPRNCWKPSAQPPLPHRQAMGLQDSEGPGDWPAVTSLDKHCPAVLRWSVRYEKH